MRLKHLHLLRLVGGRKIGAVDGDAGILCRALCRSAAVARHHHGLDAQRFQQADRARHVASCLVGEDEETLGDLARGEIDDDLAARGELVALRQEGIADLDALFFEPFALAEAHGSAVDQRLDAFAGDAARRRNAHEASAPTDSAGDEDACERMGDAVFRARGESQDRTVGKPLADDGREERPAFGDAAALRERDGADVLESAEDAGVLHEDLLCAALFQRFGQGERGGKEECGRASEEEHGEKEDRRLQKIESHGLPEGSIGDGEQQTEGEKAQGGIVRDGEQRRVLGRLRRFLLPGRVACGRLIFLCGQRLALRTPRFEFGEAALLGAQRFEFAVARLGLLLSTFLLLAPLALGFMLRHHLLCARRHDALVLVERELPCGEAHFEVFAAEREGQEEAERREEKLVKERFSRQHHLHHEEEARDDGGDGADGDE